MNSRIVIAAALAAVMVSAAAAQRQQAPQTERVNGTIERVEGNTVHAKTRNGGAIVLRLADDVAVTAVLKATLAEIKPGDYIGSGATPQADGTQKAVEIHIFAQPQRDGGHHYSGWNGNGTMTNGFVQPASVGAVIAGEGDPTLLVKYPQGEKRIVVPANTHIVRYVAGSKADLKAGEVFRVQEAVKQADGSYTASRISVGRDGARPF
jgi:hypothetical protein